MYFCGEGHYFVNNFISVAFADCRGCDAVMNDKSIVYHVVVVVVLALVSVA